MGVPSLAKLLSDPKRIGLCDELCQKLGIVDEDTTRGRLMAQADDVLPYLGVYLLGAYVVDDADVWGKGEIYWWSMPSLVDAQGRTRKSSMFALPNGAPPHKVGSLEWMTNLALDAPPLLAVVPPDEAITQLVLRLAFYDDDGAAADVPKALAAGLTTYAELPAGDLMGPEALIQPVRKAIGTSLKVEEDDILIDQDVIVRKGETLRFGRGLVGSAINAMIRCYYFVRDESRTVQFGPVSLRKGQTEMVKFPERLERAGHIALFSRGADVLCPTFGNLDTDRPFSNSIVEFRQEGLLDNGFGVTATGPAKLVAFYTPP
jgi:hypothetical protein